MTESRIVTIDSEADPLLNASCSAFHLQYQPSNEFVRRIIAAQDLVKPVSNDILFRCPPASLHMTVLTLLPARPETSGEADAAWNESGCLWADKIAKVCSAQSPFDVQFETIEVSSRAIFLKGQLKSVLERLRNAIVEEIAPFGSPLIVPNIAHISLFRFLRTRPNIQVQIPVMPPGDGTTARVETIVLTKETRYPSLERDLLASFELGR